MHGWLWLYLCANKTSRASSNPYDTLLLYPCNGLIHRQGLLAGAQSKCNTLISNPCLSFLFVGKTTLLRLVAGLESPTGGKIYFDELDATDLPVQDRQVGSSTLLRSSFGGDPWGYGIAHSKSVVVCRQRFIVNSYRQQWWQHIQQLNLTQGSQCS